MFNRSLIVVVYQAPRSTCVSTPKSGPLGVRKSAESAFAGFPIQPISGRSPTRAIVRSRTSWVPAAAWITSQNSPAALRIGARVIPPHALNVDIENMRRPG